MRGPTAAACSWIAAAFAATTGCATHVGGPLQRHALPATGGYVVQRGIEYTPAGWPQRLLADLYVPEGEGPFPAVLLVHGGRWESGTRSEMDPVATRLAQSGFVVANVDYRLAPAFRFPAPLHDLQRAVRWLRADPKRFKVDPAAIGAFGYSSGAHLVSLLATVGEHEPLAAPHGGPEARIQAVVAGGTPADLKLYGGGRGCPEFLGGTAMELPDLHALASPVTHVTADDPPFLLYHGTLDDIVPMRQAEVMMAALNAAGVPVELHLVTGAGHIALAIFTGSVVTEAIHFLDRRLRRRPASVANGAR